MIREKLTVWVGAIFITLLIPYGLTMVMTGVIGRNNVIQNFNSGMQVQIDQGGNTQNIDLEDYVVGTLASQIPIDSEDETIKAQAVIARTNVLRAFKDQKTMAASDLSFVYISKEQMLENWGEKNYQNNYNKLRLAVSKTVGETMKSEGEYIDALYHGVSTGTTVSANEVYGKNIPYLVSVDSNRDVESPNYMSITEMSYEDVRLKLSENNITVTTDALKTQLSITDKTPLGYVKKIKAGDTVIEGETWKNIFSLNSTNFYLEEFQGKLRTICLGKGHGLGMSQYGANEMAKEDKTYEDILKYYYKGISMYKITESGKDITRGD